MIVAPADGSKTRPDITCYNCSDNGHFADQSPKPGKGRGKQRDAVTALTISQEEEYKDREFMFLRAQYKGINKNWALLD
eukprot:5674841-Ditylum_brightwellii.AAC.1